MLNLNFFGAKKVQIQCTQETNNDKKSNFGSSNGNYIHYCILENIYNICASKFEDQ